MKMQATVDAVEVVIERRLNFRKSMFNKLIQYLIFGEDAGKMV